MIGRTAFLIIMMAVSCCAAEGSAQEPKPFSDDFTEDSTLKAGWILNQPNPASSFAIGPDGLLLEASGQNGGSDLWSGTNYRASLLLQPISPSANWTIITHFVFSPTIDFQAAGLILTMQPGGFTRSSKFHRFELSWQNRQNGLGIASYTNGPIDPPFTPFGGNEVYLKLTKVDATYSYYYSTTGNGHWFQRSTTRRPTVTSGSIRSASRGTAAQRWTRGPGSNRFAICRPAKLRTGTRRAIISRSRRISA